MKFHEISITKFHKVSQSYQKPKFGLFEISNDLKLNLKFHWNFNRKFTTFCKTLNNYLGSTHTLPPLKMRQKPLAVHKSFMSKFVIFWASKGCRVLCFGRDPFPIFAKIFTVNSTRTVPPPIWKYPLIRRGAVCDYHFQYFSRFKTWDFPHHRIFFIIWVHVFDNFGSQFMNNSKLEGKVWILRG